MPIGIALGFGFQGFWGLGFQCIHFCIIDMGFGVSNTHTFI